MKFLTEFYKDLWEDFITQKKVIALQKIRRT